MIKELIKIANELDSRGLVNEADALDDIIKKKKGDSSEEEGCIPLDEWPGPAAGFNLYSHSTGYTDFNNLINNGFRVSDSGMGSLGITFLEEDPNNIKESLRVRVRPDNTSYNLGTTVILAAIDPALLRDRGIEDASLENIRTENWDPLGSSGIKNVNLFEKWEEGHGWRDNAWKLPGRFLLAKYNGNTDTICLNPDWDGSTGTEYGKHLVDNLKEYNEIFNLKTRERFGPSPEFKPPPSAEGVILNDFDDIF